MRTRTGAQPLSSFCASPAAWICAQLPEAPGGGRHPKTRLMSPDLRGIPRQKPPKWRTATRHTFRHVPVLPAGSPAHRFNSIFGRVFKRRTFPRRRSACRRSASPPAGTNRCLYYGADRQPCVGTERAPLRIHQFPVGHRRRCCPPVPQPSKTRLTSLHQDGAMMS